MAANLPLVVEGKALISHLTRANPLPRRWNRGSRHSLIVRPTAYVTP